MKLVYLVTSFIIFLLSVFICVCLFKAQKKIDACKENFKNESEIFIKNFRLSAKNLKNTSKIFDAYTTFVEKEKKFKALIQIIKTLSLFVGFFGLSRHKKFKKIKFFLPLLKLLF